MKILFLKSATPTMVDSDKEPLHDKIRRILQSHLDEAKTDEDRSGRRGSLLNSTRAELDDRLELERIGLFLQNGIKYCDVRVQLPRGICDLAFERLTHAATQMEFGQLAEAVNPSQVRFAPPDAMRPDLRRPSV